MASPSKSNTFLHRLLIFSATLLLANAADIYLEWDVALSKSIRPVPSSNQSVITINGRFPGPLINATTDDVVHVNVHNFMDEPLLFTWNGIEQRLNSWQDGVSGTNCPIQPNTNWTYEFQIKDQIGTFFYFPSINFQKAAGGYGPIRVNNRPVVAVPFDKPEAGFDLLIGDWFLEDYRKLRSVIGSAEGLFTILMNGKSPYGDPTSSDYASFTVVKGKTYMFMISNVGNAWSFNFRIQNHKMVLVETEGSYTNQITLDSLDVHVGQSYSVLVTADQKDADFFIMASPKMFHNHGVFGLGVLHYSSSKSNVTGPLPTGPDPFDTNSSVTQARSIKWNLTTGAARANPQGTFNVSHVTPTQTFFLVSSTAEINNVPRYVVNNVSYHTGETPLKIADYVRNTTAVYQLDSFPVRSVNHNAFLGTSVVSGTHKGWIELVFKNSLDNVIDSWHLDGFGFFVVGFGFGDWTFKSRSTYNLVDPVVRSTTQVYPGGWTVVYAYLDNPGMWNLRSQRLQNWYLGQELYVRVHDDDPNPAKERLPPNNLLLCGKFVNHPGSSQTPPQQPAVHQHGIQNLAPAAVAAPWIGNTKLPLSPSPVASISFPAATEPVNVIAREFNPTFKPQSQNLSPTPSSIALPPNAPAPAPEAAQWNQIGKHLNPTVGAWTENLAPIPSAAPWIGSPPTPSSIPFPPNPPPQPPIGAQWNQIGITRDLTSKLAATTPSTEISSPVPVSVPWIGTRPTPPPIVLPPNAPPPTPEKASWNDISTEEVQGQLLGLKKRRGIQEKAALAPTGPTPIISPAPATATSRTPTPSQTPLVSRAQRTTESVAGHHFQPINIPLAYAPAPAPTARIPTSPSPPPSVSGARESTEYVVDYHSHPINGPSTQALAPAPTAISPTPSPTPSVPGARESTKNVADHHSHPINGPSTQALALAPTTRTPTPSPTPSISGARESTEDVANYDLHPINGPSTQAIAPAPTARTPTPSPTPSASGVRESTEYVDDHRSHPINGPSTQAQAHATAPALPPTSWTPTPSISGARRSIENVADYHSQGPTQAPFPVPWVRKPNAPAPTPIAAPVPTPTPTVATTYGNTWARWWWT